MTTSLPFHSNTVLSLDEDIPLLPLHKEYLERLVLRLLASTGGKERITSRQELEGLRINYDTQRDYFVLHNPNPHNPILIRGVAVEDLQANILLQQGKETIVAYVCDIPPELAKKQSVRHARYFF